MSAAFTPGPWTVPSASFPDDEKGVAYHVCAENICMSAANANLIAAAPDLYAACEAFVKAGNMSAFSAQANATLAKAHDLAIAALAKARGEPA